MISLAVLLAASYIFFLSFDFHAQLSHMQLVMIYFAAWLAASRVVLCSSAFNAQLFYKQLVMFSFVVLLAVPCSSLGVPAVLRHCTVLARLICPWQENR